MKTGLVLSLALAAAAAGCGDNSKECGEGTTDKDGVCTPDGTAVCGNGTTLDGTTGACVPDPSLCGGGTVLVNGICQDPTAGLTVDLEEGPEPNGLEAGANPAGTITLKPIGDANGFVIKGCVKPTSDQADLDDYLLTVTGPTLIDITADGVQGLAAGFVTLANPNDPILGASWQRFGVNLANDMSHREIYLPKAGTYDFVMSDTRSLLGLLDGAADTLEAAGNPDGTSCYYVTLKQEAIPTPTAMAVPAGASGTFDNKVHFYAPQMPTGFIDVTASTTSTHAAAALVLNVSNNLFAIDDAGEIFTAGIKATDTSVLVADFVFDYGIAPGDYSVDFASASTAQALPTDGTTIMDTVNGSTFAFPDFSTTNQYYFDATSAGQLIGMDIALQDGVHFSGVIADVNGVFIDSSLAWGGLAGAATWTSYKGLWRAPAPGRYYLIMFDPTAAHTGDDFHVQSTLTTVTATTATVGTPLTAQANNAFNSVPYNVSIAGNTWDSVNATGTNTGNLVVSFVDPATAKGRLNTLTLTTAQANANAAPIATYNIPAAGGAKGLIAKSIAQTALLATVAPQAPTAGATFGLDIGTRVFTDYAALAAGTATHLAETAAAGDAHRYYFTTAPGNKVTITVHPTTATDNPILETLTGAEAVVQGPTTAAAGANDVVTFVMGAAGFSAFQVRGTAAAAETYDLTILIQTPFYTSHAGTTTFADACTGGTVIDMDDTDEGYSLDAITPPAGFNFYGAAATDFLVSTNGFLTFNLAATGTSYSSAVLPDGAGKANIAPFWQDIENVEVCTKTVGTKLVVQWTGDQYNDGKAVQFQAILDPADGSIEYVFGPDQEATGSEANFAGIPATQGVQTTTGAEGTMSGNGRVAGFAMANHATKLTHP